MNSSAARLAMTAASGRIRTSAFARLSLIRCRPQPFERPQSLLLRDDPGAIRRGDPAPLVEFLFADAPPGTPIAFQKVFCFYRAPRACRIVWESSSRQSAPNVKDWLNYCPARLHHVRSLNERGVARHTTAQQPFGAGAVLHSEIGAVIEVHVHEAEFHDRAGNLRAETQGNAFLR